MSTKKTVLITGATGLVGSYIADAFAQDSKLNIVLTKRPSSNLALCKNLNGNNITWKTGDLLDPYFQKEIVEQADAIVHVAGLVSYHKKDRKRLDVNNVELTKNLLNWSLKFGIKHFIHISSIAAISPSLSQNNVDESQKIFHENKATTYYAKTKFRAELDVWRAAEEGLNTTILNPSMVLGAGFWNQSSCQLFPWVNQGQKYYPPGTTGYVDVRDLAAFAKLSFDEQKFGQRYILNAENLSYKNFFEEVATNLGVKAPNYCVKPWQAELAWRVEALKKKPLNKAPLLTKETARRSMLSYHFDNSKSIAAGASYRPVSETISEVASVYKATSEQGYGHLTTSVLT